MVSSVKSQPNHYETLGLTPGASSDDVAEAFATTSRRHIEDPRAMEPDMRERARQIRMAHETLRDPAKRRAYDQSLGLSSEAGAERPQAPAEPSAVPFVAAPPEPAAPSAVEETREPTTPAEPPVAHFIAANLRDPANRRSYYTSPAPKPEPQVEPAPPREPEVEQAPLPEPEPQHQPEAFSEHDSERAVAAQERIYVDTAVPYVEERRRGPRRAAAAALVALLAVIALVAFLMWPFGRNVDRAPDTLNARAAPGAGPPPMPSSAMPQLPPQTLPSEDMASQLAQESVGSVSGSVAPADGGPVPARIAAPLSASPRSSASQPTTETPPAASKPDPLAAVSEPAAEAPPVAERQSPTAGPTQAVPVGVAAPAPAPAPPPVPTPALGVNRQAPARLTSGALTSRDNPHGAFQGTVSVRFVVGRSGQVTGCEATASSGSPGLGTRTCALVAQKLRFSPALNPQGRPISSEMRATYTWGRTQRSLTGRLLDLVRKRPQ